MDTCQVEGKHRLSSLLRLVPEELAPVLVPRQGLQFIAPNIVQTLQSNGLAGLDGIGRLNANQANGLRQFKRKQTRLNPNDPLQRVARPSLKLGVDDPQASGASITATSFGSTIVVSMVVVVVANIYNSRSLSKSFINLAKAESRNLPLIVIAFAASSVGAVVVDCYLSESS